MPTLALLEALALLLGGLFWFRMRPELRAAYGTLTGLPWTARLALSSFVPAVGLCGAALVLAGLSLRVGARTKVWLVGAGLVTTAFALAFALVAGWGPAFVAA